MSTQASAGAPDPRAAGRGWCRYVLTSLGGFCCSALPASPRCPADARTSRFQRVVHHPDAILTVALQGLAHNVVHILKQAPRAAVTGGMLVHPRTPVPGPGPHRLTPPLLAARWCPGTRATYPPSHSSPEANIGALCMSPGSWTIPGSWQCGTAGLWLPGMGEMVCVCRNRGSGSTVPHLLCHPDHAFLLQFQPQAGHGLLC